MAASQSSIRRTKMRKLTRLALAGGVVLGTGLLAVDLAQAGGPRGHDGMHGHGGAGAMEMFDRFDQDGDGRVTAEEVTGQRTARLQEFDTNGDGTLSLEEYEALWADAMRERMVRGFQRHDRDGDGQVTAEEFERPFTRMADRLDRDGDGAVSREEVQDMLEHHDSRRR
jgi:Ca2+-binding EF-hand superfamily protein